MFKVSFDAWFFNLFILVVSVLGLALLYVISKWVFETIGYNSLWIIAIPTSAYFIALVQKKV